MERPILQRQSLFRPASQIFLPPWGRKHLQLAIAGCVSKPIPGCQDAQTLEPTFREVQPDWQLR